MLFEWKPLESDPPPLGHTTADIVVWDSPDSPHYPVRYADLADPAADVRAKGLALMYSN